VPVVAVPHRDFRSGGRDGDSGSNGARSDRGCRSRTRSPEVTDGASSAHCRNQETQGRKGAKAQREPHAPGTWTGRWQPASPAEAGSQTDRDTANPIILAESDGRDRPAISPGRRGPMEECLDSSAGHRRPELRALPAAIARFARLWSVALFAPLRLCVEFSRDGPDSCGEPAAGEAAAAESGAGAATASATASSVAPGTVTRHRTRTRSPEVTDGASSAHCKNQETQGRKGAKAQREPHATGTWTGRWQPTSPAEAGRQPSRMNASAPSRRLSPRLGPSSRTQDISLPESDRPRYREPDHPGGERWSRSPGDLAREAGPDGRMPGFFRGAPSPGTAGSARSHRSVRAPVECGSLCAFASLR
jgi:hypothetical protein